MVTSEIYSTRNELSFPESKSYSLLSNEISYIDLSIMKMPKKDLLLTNLFPIVINRN